LFYRFSSKSLVCFLALRKIKNKLKEPSYERSTKEAIKIIRENKGKNPFFMWIDYDDTHMPYNPNNFSERFKDYKGRVGKIISKYDGAIFYDDSLIGEVLETLKEEKLFDSTIIFFLSDHGESLGEHGIYFDHHGLYDVSFNTPLIIHAKGLKNKKITALAQLEDLTPTALDLAGIKYDQGIFDGKSLFPLMKGKEKEIRESIFMEECYLAKKIALRTEDYKYIEAKSKKDATCIKCNKIHGGVIELYDLKKDSEENINLAKKNKKKLVNMKIQLDKEIKKIKTLSEKRRLSSVLSKL